MESTILIRLDNDINSEANISASSATVKFIQKVDDSISADTNKHFTKVNPINQPVILLEKFVKAISNRPPRSSAVSVIDLKNLEPTDSIIRMALLFDALKFHT
ncbi:hypothetical protein WUBG_18827 [Wuchereria bancrofti]|uniref:Uncharacterized protein n=1 Tax=Wuchereria bancrofti TaxID=6293 RepID=J9A8K3_WUCBA|nr:hypothetical protein WUBG_18827 [Wuchereria bancrofti]VDM07502.1 unnamed protein product [Wuchereria bancrofti]